MTSPIRPMAIAINNAGDAISDNCPIGGKDSLSFIPMNRNRLLEKVINQSAFLNRIYADPPMNPPIMAP